MSAREEVARSGRVPAPSRTARFPRGSGAVDAGGLSEPIAALLSRLIQPSSVHLDHWLVAVLPAGSSTLIATSLPRAWPETSGLPRAASRARPARERLNELRAALALNKSELSRVLRVSRPTVYEWLSGAEPSIGKARRLSAVEAILEEAGVSSDCPLGARLVREPSERGGPSLLDLLTAAELDHDRAVAAAQRVLHLAAAANRAAARREARFRDLGYEAAHPDQRRHNAARNLALRDAPDA